MLIALWQIHGLKSKVETTEERIRSILEMKEHEKFRRIFMIVVDQYQEIGALVSQINLQGKTIPTIMKKCKEIIKRINSCIIEIPPQYIEILDNFKRTIEHLEKFLESNMQYNTELKEARDYLNNAIQRMKHEEKDFEAKTITMVSHYNE